MFLTLSWFWSHQYITRKLGCRGFSHSPTIGYICICCKEWSPPLDVLALGYTGFHLFRSGLAFSLLAVFTRHRQGIDRVRHMFYDIYDVFGSGYTAFAFPSAVCEHLRQKYAAVAAPSISASVPYPMGLSSIHTLQCTEEAHMTSFSHHLLTLPRGPDPPSIHSQANHHLSQTFSRPCCGHLVPSCINPQCPSTRCEDSGLDAMAQSSLS